MILLALLLMASHGDGPYDWHMSCDRWQKKSIEIIADKEISLKQREYLIRYLRSKVDGPCPNVKFATL